MEIKEFKSELSRIIKYINKLEIENLDTNGSDKHIELAHFDYDWTFRMYSTYIFKSNRNLKQLFIYTWSYENRVGKP